MNPRTLLARERFRKWDIQARWKKFEHKLGPIPAKFMDVGPPPQGLAAFSEAWFASGIIEHMTEYLNSETTLLKFIREEPHYVPPNYPGER